MNKALWLLLLVMTDVPLRAQESKSDMLPVREIYEIKWRKADDIAQLLKGFVRGNVGVSRAFNSITVEARPGEQTFAAELIRKYDTHPRKVGFQFHILKALRTGGGIEDGLPPAIQEVIKDIASLTRYQRFELLSSPMITANEGNALSGLSGHVILEMTGIRVVYSDQKEDVRIVVDEFRFETRAPVSTNLAATLALGGKEPRGATLASFQTSFSVADEETIVLGSSEIGEAKHEFGDAVIVVVTSHVIDRRVGVQK